MVSVRTGANRGSNPPHASNTHIQKKQYMQQILSYLHDLHTSEQILLVSVFCLCIIGIIDIIVLIRKSFSTDLKLVNNYLKAVDSLIKKVAQKKNYPRERDFIIRKSDKLTGILGKDRFLYPENELSTKIAYRNVYGISELQDLYSRINADATQWDEARQKRKWIYVLELIVPILFWLFRGFQVVLMLITYMLNILGVNIKPESKINIVLSWLFTFLSGLASILSYCGYSFKD